MKIPASLQGSTPIAHTPTRRTEAEDRQLGRPDHGRPVLHPSQVDRVDIPRGAGGGTDDNHGDGLTRSERVDRLAARFEKRLDKLMEREGLTPEQISELQGAKEDFHALVDRLKNALDTIQPGVASRAFRTMVSDLGESVRSTLAEEHDGDNTRVGGGDGIVPAPVPPDDAEDVPHITPVSVEKVGGSGGDSVGNDPLNRLQEVQERFDARFAAYLSREGLDPEQADALQAAKDQFDKVLQRLSNAYSKGEKDASFLRFGFNTALEGLRDQLAEILPEEHDHYGRPDSRLQARDVELYGAGGLQDVLGSMGQASVDHVV